MNTITIHSTATNTPILAIDLGKYKSVVCVFQSLGDVRFRNLPTARADATHQRAGGATELRRFIKKAASVYSSKLDVSADWPSR